MAGSARYEIKKVKRKNGNHFVDEYVFSLIAANNKVLAECEESYSTKEAAIKGIEALQKIAVSADIRDLTE
ncbi:MAG: YegP family protein [Clostridiales bacterium]|jgi:uncharacterized protein YegP (UPF0339 family)|nr:YegP family protein [Clostridiales bacterium]